MQASPQKFLFAVWMLFVLTCDAFLSLLSLAFTVGIDKYFGELTRERCPVMCTVRAFQKRISPKDALGLHSCSLEALTGGRRTAFFSGSHFLTDSHCELRPNTEGRSCIKSTISTTTKTSTTTITGTTTTRTTTTKTATTETTTTTDANEALFPGLHVKVIDGTHVGKFGVIVSVAAQSATMIPSGESKATGSIPFRFFEHFSTITST
jgi:hypothetical protein